MLVNIIFFLLFQVKADSFFNFFDPPQVPDDPTAEVDEDTQVYLKWWLYEIEIRIRRILLSRSKNAQKETFLRDLKCFKFFLFMKVEPEKKILVPMFLIRESVPRD